MTLIQKGDEAIVLPASLSIIKFYATNYSSVPLLNTYQILEQCQPVSELLTEQINIAMYYKANSFIDN